MSKITTIIPIHTVADDTLVWFGKAIESIKESRVLPSEVLIIRCQCDDVKTELEKYDFGVITDIVRIIENPTEESDFASQIREAAKEVKTEYLTFLEIDDEISKIWFKNVDEHIKAYPEVDAFLPIIVDTSPDGNFLGFTNEPAWAMGFADEIGFIDNNSLMDYNNFNACGIVIKTEKFNSIGGFKSNIKLSFIYEFLLRLTYNDTKLMVIPKIGYKHTNMRENSIFYNYKHKNDEKLMPEEAKFWMDSAKKEYFFKEDRTIKFEPNAVN